MERVPERVTVRERVTERVMSHERAGKVTPAETDGEEHWIYLCYAYL